MAPTTLAGQKTTTSPYGRDAGSDGYPIRMAELIAGLGAVAYSARVAVDNPKNLMKAAKTIRKAFEYQVENKGFAFVEVLAACPTNWAMDPIKANERVGSEMIPYFPLGVFKDAPEGIEPQITAV